MYTTFDAIVSDVLNIYDNTEDTSVQQVTNRTNRILHYIQRTIEDLWYDPRVWSFTMASDILTMAAGESAFPDDFAQVSGEGGLFDANGKPWVEIPYQDMAYLRGRSLEQNSRFYAIGATIRVPNVQSTEGFTLIYQKVAPTAVLVNDNTLLADAGFPPVFGEAILLGTVSKLKEEEGDARQTWRMDYMKALSRVASVWSKNRTRVSRMPVTIGGMW